jgi:hypothetical protein
MVMNHETIAGQLREIVRHMEAGRFESVDSECGVLLGEFKRLFTPVRDGSKARNSCVPLMWQADYFGYDRVSRVARQVATVRCTLSSQNLMQALSNAKAALARWE